MCSLHPKNMGKMVPPLPPGSTLNQQKRVEVQLNINKENKKLLHRLSHARSVYDCRKWFKDSNMNKYRIEQMSKNSGKFSQHPHFQNKRSRSQNRLTKYIFGLNKPFLMCRSRNRMVFQDSSGRLKITKTKSRKQKRKSRLIRLHKNKNVRYVLSTLTIIFAIVVTKHT